MEAMDDQKYKINTAMLRKLKKNVTKTKNYTVSENSKFMSSYM